MVPENIIWAAFSAYDYQTKINAAAANGKPEPKDVYYQTPKGEWVKVTAVFDCIATLRRTYNQSDVKYLGPVLANTKGEVERGLKYPPCSEDKKTAEERRKVEIRQRLAKSDPKRYSKILLKYKDGSLNAPPVTKDLSGFWKALDSYGPDDDWMERY